MEEYEQEQFIGFFTYFIKNQPLATEGALNDFDSKLKDFTYLIALNGTGSGTGTKKIEVTDPVIKKWAKDLRKIKNFYQNNSVGDLDNLERNDESIQKVINYISFHTYFENGTLSYVEQDLDRLKRVFQPFENQIEEEFGFDINFLTDFYKFSELVTARKNKDLMAFAETDDFAKFLLNTNKTFQERIEELPEDIYEQMNKFKNCTYTAFKFVPNDYYTAFPKHQVKKNVGAIDLHSEAR
ncbi:hypothetical protein [Pedobacter sp. SYSU D00535]|uniref:hypothetical protein n=1 Tax=Pedobacter sp. SYSU D00535 TaxID=2810308 RepID=UPI001A96646C|nr:hypothetical protein [Pedobacter sp. SYSU D00535]